MQKIIITSLISVAGLTLKAQDLTQSSFGKGLINILAADSSYNLKFAARFQSLYTSDWSGENNLENQQSNFLIRRARLKFDGFAYTPKLGYKIELALSNRDISGASVYTSNASRIVLDAVIKWNFYGNFVLWAGQTKLPGNRERVISSGDLQFVDRSLLNSQFNIDRDMGVQLFHHVTVGSNFLIKKGLAISQGEGRNVTSGNLGGLQWTARAEFFPFGAFKKKGAYVGSDIVREERPKLAVGITYDYNDDAVKSRSNLGSYMLTETGFFETDIQSLFVDAMFKFRGLSFMGEYAQRNAENSVAKNADGTETGDVVNSGTGINLQAGYLFHTNWEIAFRYTDIALEEIDDHITEQYTLGVSKFVVGHKLKVQSDLSYGNWNESPMNNLLYRLQFDIHF